MSIATFRGIHNATKSKVLIVLYSRLYSRGIKTGLSLRGLADITGCPYNSINSKLGKWVEWNYILRHMGSNGGTRPVFTYTIAKRGRKFVEKWIPRDRLKDYIAEIREFKANK